MAALTPIIATNAGVVSSVAGAGSAVASTDTIALAVMGPHGALLNIINGNASPDAMTITDPGVTQAGNALVGGTIAASVANATSKVFWIRREQANPTTGLVTITHGTTATVSYQLYPV